MKPSNLYEHKRRESISFLVYKNEVADVVKTVDKISDIIKNQKNIHGDKVKFIFNNDNSRVVRDKFKIVANNGLLGLLLVN